MLKHGFAKGSGRVGRSTKLEDDAKVQLAVVAHARHSNTQYESLLRKLDRDPTVGLDVRKSARDAIKNDLEKVLASWRREVVPKRRLSNTVKPASSKVEKKMSKAKLQPQRKIIDKSRVTKNTAQKPKPKTQTAKLNGLQNAKKMSLPKRTAYKTKSKKKR